MLAENYKSNTDILRLMQNRNENKKKVVKYGFNILLMAFALFVMFASFCFENPCANKMIQYHREFIIASMTLIKTTMTAQRSAYVLLQQGKMPIN